MLSPIHVVGIGLDGAMGLSSVSQSVVDRATILVGSDRHLSYFPHHAAQRIRLGNLQEAIATIQTLLTSRPSSSQHPLPQDSEIEPELTIVVLVSGDPLFFGLGRLLLQSFPPEQLTFYPHLSSIQLAFNRIKQPWHDATIMSLHGRTMDALIPLLKKGTDKIALLTDGTNTPEAIARLLQSLALPLHYRMWVCENLGGEPERIQSFAIDTLSPLTIDHSFAALNVVILIRDDTQVPIDPDTLPMLGLSDQSFVSFSDRPGLMTKREVRTLILGELQLKPHQTIWDIGAGTGSVSIEMARLNPTATIYSIEKTTVGVRLIEANVRRFQVANVTPIQGVVPDAIAHLPPPDRIFIGGSGGHLESILDSCGVVLADGGCLVIAVATLDHQAQVMQWLDQQRQTRHCSKPYDWDYHMLSINLSRSLPIGPLTRLQPLNPVMILSLTKIAT